jgi:hypothetical protein
MVMLLDWIHVFEWHMERIVFAYHYLALWMRSMGQVFGKHNSLIRMGIPVYEEYLGRVLF